MVSTLAGRSPIAIAGLAALAASASPTSIAFIAVSLVTVYAPAKPQIAES